MSEPIITQCDARRLTLAELHKLSDWTDNERFSFFDGLDAQGVLELWHAMGDWDGLDVWRREEPNAAEQLATIRDRVAEREELDAAAAALPAGDVKGCTEAFELLRSAALAAFQWNATAEDDNRLRVALQACGVLPNPLPCLVCAVQLDGEPCTACAANKQRWARFERGEKR